MKASMQLCVFLAACCFIGLRGTEGQTQSVRVTTFQPGGGSFASSQGAADALDGFGLDGLLAGLIGDFQRETMADQNRGGPRNQGNQPKPAGENCRCNEVSPPAAEGETQDGSTCQNRKERGECDASYMLENNFCECTCDRCKK